MESGRKATTSLLISVGGPIAAFFILLTIWAIVTP